MPCEDRLCLASTSGVTSYLQSAFSRALFTLASVLSIMKSRAQGIPGSFGLELPEASP